MTNNFDTELVAITPEFLDVYGEDVKYWPLGATEAREIKAVVERNVPDDLSGMPHGQSHKITIWVANDAMTGIAGTEVDRGGDQIELPIRIGNTAKKRPISQILSQDAGMLQLELC